MIKTKVVLAIVLLAFVLALTSLVTSPTTKKLVEKSISLIGPSNQTSPTPTTLLKPMPSSPDRTFLVKKVVDGDTIELENGQKVRYIGIDTPETVDPRKVVQCFGIEASDKNKELVEGEEVRLERDISDTDKFGRLLRYVFVGDGTFVNLVLVKEGYAKSSSYPPDVKYQELLKKGEIEAREKGVGLWSSC